MDNIDKVKLKKEIYQFCQGKHVSKEEIISEFKLTHLLATQIMLELLKETPLMFFTNGKYYASLIEGYNDPTRHRPCPKCDDGIIAIHPRGVYCINEDCDYELTAEKV
jgi:hypothetical protein